MREIFPSIVAQLVHSRSNSHLARRRAQFKRRYGVASDSIQRWGDYPLMGGSERPLAAALDWAKFDR